jgi:hypothetical protein
VLREVTGLDELNDNHFYPGGDMGMHYLGVDLGGTKVTYVLADDKGDFLFQQTFVSPFKKTPHKLPDGSPEVYLDSVMTHVPLRQRALSYLVHIERQFLKEAQKAIGIGTYDKK